MKAPELCQSYLFQKKDRSNPLYQPYLESQTQWLVPYVW
jgi:hypothetical protein